MFTWHVPKFKDYVGTPMEPVAQFELETALKVSEIFIRAIIEASGEASGNEKMSEDTARFHMIWMWSQMHGFIAGINNPLRCLASLDYGPSGHSIFFSTAARRILPSARDSICRTRSLEISYLSPRTTA